MSDLDVDALLSGAAEPSPEFRAQLLGRLRAKQRQLGRAPVAPASPFVPSRPSSLALAAATGAALVALGVGLARFEAPEGPRPVRVTHAPPALPPAIGPDVAPEATHAALQAPALVEAAVPVRRVLADGTVLYLDAGGRVRIEGPREIVLERGRAFLEVAKGTPFRVRGPSGEAVAHGTKLALSDDGGCFEVAVAQGKVAVKNPRGEVLLGPGQLARVRPVDEAAPRAEPADRLSHCVGWARELYDLSLPKHVRTGEVVVVDGSGQESRLGTRRVHVDVHVEDGIARTTIDATYFNHTWWRLEGQFRFPLPAGASISRLAMYVDGKLMEGGVAERSHARNVYESIVHARRDPALLEWQEGNVFKMRIFPIEARQEKRVILSFTQELEPLYGTYRYRLPLEGREQIGKLSVHARVRGGASAFAQSPGWALERERQGEDLVLRGALADVRPDRDLVLELAAVPAARAVTATEDGARWAVARFEPDLSGMPRLPREPRRWAVVFDTSGSRPGPERRAQRDVLERLLREWDDGDRVTVIAAGATPRVLGEWLPVRAASKALAFLDGLPSVGATDFASACDAAARALQGASGDVVYLGDAIATLGEKDPRKIASVFQRGIRFVGVGVGRRVDTTVLAALARATGGAVARVENDDAVAWRVFDLVQALETPRLSGLEAIALDAEGNAVAGDLRVSRPVVAQGEDVRVVGRFPGALPAKIVLRGRALGRDWSSEVSLVEARDTGTWIPRLWARGRIEDLLREGAARHQAEITALGKKFFLVTPFTSLLVLETDADYARFQIERGSLEKFARYDAPATIPVVTEGDPTRIQATPVRRFATIADLERSIARRRVPAYAWDTTLVTDFDAFFRDEVRDWDERAFIPGLRDITALPQLRAGFEWNGGGVVTARTVTKSGELAGIAPLAELESGKVQLAASGRIAFDGILRRQMAGEWAGFVDRATFVGDLGRFGYLEWGRRSQRGILGAVYPYHGTWAHDLTFFAPGLEATLADVAGLADKEVPCERPEARHDPVAVERLAQARRAFGRRAFELALSDGSRVEGVARGDGTCDFSRRHLTRAFERLIAREDAIEVAYPELGVSGIRPRTRWHEAELGELLAFLLPGERTLAGFHLEAKGERTIVLAPVASKDEKHPSLELDLGEDGRVFERRLVSEGKVLARLETPRGLALRPSDAARPELPEGLCRLELPVRTEVEGDLARAFSHLLQGRYDQAFQLLTSTMETGLFRYVLLAAFGWYQQPAFAEGAAKRPNEPFFRYIAALQVPYPEQRLEAFEKLAAELPEGLVGTLATYRAAAAAVEVARPQAANDPTRLRAHRKVESLALRTRDARLVLAAAGELADLLAYVGTPAEVDRVVALLDETARTPSCELEARYRAAALLGARQRFEEATRRFEALYEDARARGRFPLFDARLMTAMKGVKDGLATRFDTFLAKTLASAESARDTEALLALGWSAYTTGIRSVAERALRVLPELKEPEEKYAAELLARNLYSGIWNDLPNAERLVRELLASPAFAYEPWLHDIAAHAAQQQGKVAQAAADLERATELAALAESEVRLEVFRDRHARLVGLLKQLAHATTPAGAKAPEVARRVRAAAERWRTLDGENEQLWTATGDALLACGAADEAWEVASTTIELAPFEGRTWSSVAYVYAQAGQTARAADLYDAAFAAEPTDPTPLLHAAHLRALLGQHDEARARRERIANGAWQDRFQGVAQQARSLLGR